MSQETCGEMREMLGALFAALRPALAMIIIGASAVVIVAPAFDMASHRTESRAASSGADALRNHPDATPRPDEDDPDADSDDPPMVDFDTLLRDCLETREPDSDQCAAAALQSGMTYEDFRAKIVAKLAPAPTEKPAPKVEPTKKPAVVATKPAPVATKKPDVRQDDFATYFAKCLDSRDIDSDLCIRAEELSGLSFGDFEDKFNAKLAAKDSGDFWVWFEKCLDSRDLGSDTCVRAQQLIGFNDSDFHAKFDRYLADRDAKMAKATPKPTAKPTPVVETYEALFLQCGQSRDHWSFACFKALNASGLPAPDFWTKIEAKFGFH
jgi:hypothetical protein